MEAAFRTKHHEERPHIHSNICKRTAILVTIQVPFEFLFQQNDGTITTDDYMVKNTQRRAEGEFGWRITLEKSQPSSLEWW